MASLAIPRTLRILTSLLAVAGTVALHLGDLLGTVGAGIAVAAVGAAAWRSWLLPLVDRRPAIRAALVVAGASAWVLDVLYLTASLLDGFAHLLLLLVLARLLTLRSPRETRVILYLSFFMLVAASGSALGAAYLLVFLAFVVFGTWTLLLQHVLVELDPAPGRTIVGGPVDPSPVMVRLAAAAAVLTLLITSVLFFVIPRVGQAALPFRARLAAMTAGFTDRVELGQSGQIESDSTVIMRVHVEGLPGDPAGAALRWRGMALDRFDGRTWTGDRASRVAVTRSGVGDFRLAAPSGTGPLLLQEIFLEPIGSEVVFAAPRALRFGLRTSALLVDDMDGVAVAAPSARLHYTVVSELESPGRPAGRRDEAPLSAGARARYLQLPPVPPRVAALAREIAGSAREPLAVSQTLTSHLSREYRYTLALERTTTLDPIEEFLFVRRSGNCEYFAAALAVMLRSLGIPARVIGGFQRGEWNPYGRYFMVRLSDAHAWVEAYIDAPPGGRRPGGWMTLDPSPREEAQARARSAVGLYVDAVRMGWYRYVINWSLRDQIEAASSVRRRADAWRSLPLSAGWPSGLPLFPLGAGALLAGTAALGLWYGRGRARRGAAAAMPHFYAAALALLARAGLAPERSETAREFSERAACRLPAAAAPLRRLTAGYERSRFGAVELGPETLSGLASAVAEIDLVLRYSR
ncbi:MAG: DUF3488 and transglutaminase-like domain-containing protein [Candidatus Rokubacteria bacterium]|nr:DUF3488 and transglutaminase-like domain-containing protein [Candidatus Rokubacteria bacterium]